LPHVAKRENSQKKLKNKSRLSQDLTFNYFVACVRSRIHIQSVHSVTSQQQVRVFKEYVFDVLLKRCFRLLYTLNNDLMSTIVSLRQDSRTKHINDDIWFKYALLNICCVIG